MQQQRSKRKGKELETGTGTGNIKIPGNCGLCVTTCWTVHCLLPHRHHVIVRLWLPAGAVHSGISNRSNRSLSVSGNNYGHYVHFPMCLLLTHTMTCHMSDVWGQKSFLFRYITKKISSSEFNRKLQVSSTTDSTQLSKSLSWCLSSKPGQLFFPQVKRKQVLPALNASCFFVCFRYLQTWQLTSEREV